MSHLLDGRWSAAGVAGRPDPVGGRPGLVRAAPDLWQLAASPGASAGWLTGWWDRPPASVHVGVAPQARATRLGRLSSVQMGGIVLGPLVGIELADVGGLGTPFLVLAGLLWLRAR